MKRFSWSDGPRRRPARKVCLALVLLIGAGCTGVSGEPSVQFLGSYHWRADQRSFGGFSGLEVSADGTRFRVVSDQSLTLEGTFLREAGQIVGVQHGRLQETIGPDGVAIWRNDVRDAEGLADLGNGQFAISFEGIHQVLVFDGPGKSVALPQHPDFASFGTNSSLESLAVDAAGALYVVPEKSGNLTSDFPVYRYRDGAWDIAFTLPRSEGFLPVGMDFGPDGRLYVLERSFDGIGFRSRIRRVTLPDGGRPQHDLLLTTRLRQFDNLEGLAVWTDASGRLRLTAISDDNFRSFQRTQFVEFAITE